MEQNAAQLLLSELRQKLQNKGIQAEYSAKPFALEIEGNLKVLLTPMDADTTSLGYKVTTFHPVFFLEGINISLHGTGDSLEKQVATIADKYITGVFGAIWDSIKKANYAYIPDDMEVDFDGQKLMFGVEECMIKFLCKKEWNINPLWESNTNVYFDQVVTERLENRTFNWMENFFYANDNGVITSVCIFNNKYWVEGSIQQIYAILKVIPHLQRDLQKDKEYVTKHSFTVFYQKIISA
jgi:hypothetical protein